MHKDHPNILLVKEKNISKLLNVLRKYKTSIKFSLRLRVPASRQAGVRDS
jgi:hypothetical protein